MCSREELNDLIHELLYHIEKVGTFSAQIQFENELKSVEYLTCCAQTNTDMKTEMTNTRLKQLIRFHVAYMRYFVFAFDPYAEIFVPLSSSSLTLFITNIVSKTMPEHAMVHTSRSILEFLQVFS